MRTKVLNRTTVCVKFPPLRQPIWNGGKRCVGLKAERIGDHNEVEIIYRNKDGERIYPELYYFDGKDKDKYPIKSYSFGDMLIVPIADLQILQRVDKLPKQGSLEELEDWMNSPGYAKSRKELDNQ